MTGLKQDLALAVRRLAAAPGFAALVIATLALGIGLTTTVFALVHSVVLRPFSFPEPDRLAFPMTVGPGKSPAVTSYLKFLDWQARSQTFSHVGFSHPEELTLRRGQDLERIPGMWVSAGYFPALGVEPFLGRLFTPAEADRPGAPVVLLGYRLWQRRFGGDPRTVGRLIEVNQVPLRVVGILPPGFRGLRSSPEIFVPMPLCERLSTSLRQLGALADRDFSWGFLLGRLAPGAGLSRALAELRAAGVEEESRLGLVGPRQALLRDLGAQLLRLFGAASFVLLIACANVGNLLLTRAAGRHRETAVRAALGATRGQLVRHWLLEGLLLGLAGGAAGLLTAGWGLDLLLAVLPLEIPPVVEVRTGWPVAAFALALSLLAGGLAILAPALHSAWPDLAGSLKQGGRGASGNPASRRTRGLLVTVDVALALMLLIGAGLMVRSLERIRSFDPGFRSRDVLTLGFEPPNHATDAERVRIKREILERIAILPGVRSAALTSTIFFDRRGMLMLRLAGHPDGSASAYVHYVSSGFFQTLGIPLQAGRDFLAADHRDKIRCAIVNRAFVESYLPPGNPIGRRIVLANDPENPLEVVGVAGNVRMAVEPGEPTEPPQVYLPGLGSPLLEQNLVIATEDDSEDLTSLVRRTIRRLSPDTVVFDVARLDARVSSSTSRTRSFTELMGAFAGASLALAVLGIYSLTVFLIQREARNIAVRRALGAGPWPILRLLLVRGSIPVLLGIALGLGGAFLLARTLSAFLFNVAPLDPMTFLIAPLLLAAAALSACLLAAQKALEIEPMAALREEGAGSRWWR